MSNLIARLESWAQSFEEHRKHDPELTAIHDQHRDDLKEAVRVLRSVAPSQQEPIAWVRVWPDGECSLERAWADAPRTAKPQESAGTQLVPVCLPARSAASTDVPAVTDDMIERALAVDTSLIQGFSYPNRSAIIDYRTDYGLGVELWSAPATTLPDIDSAKMNAELARVKMKVVLSAALADPRNDRGTPQFMATEGREFNGPSEAPEAYCCSSITPCAHIRQFPNSICEMCMAASGVNPNNGEIT